MNINLSYIEIDKRIAFIELSGELDARSFSDLMQQAKLAHDSGAQFLLLDLSKLGFMSSSGLSALHSMSLLMQDYDALDRDTTPVQPGGGEPPPTNKKPNRVKLINPQPRILRALEMSGFSELYEIYDDPASAIDSCRPNN